MSVPRERSASSAAPPLRPGPELPYPSGWFALASGAELRPGAILTRRLAGDEYVLFRDEEGLPAAVGAYCPHLGAHMGRGGCVEAGTVVCPFHGFRFDRTGACVATGYGTRPPKDARVRSLPVVESGGWVFAWWHHAGAAPTWTPPVLSEEGWTPLHPHALELRTHPQETTENSVDLGHFPRVHGYRDVVYGGIAIDGPHLQTRYAFTRPGWFPGFGAGLRVEIEVHVWGLGFSYVDVTLPKLELETRQFVLPTAIAPGWTELRLAMTLRRTPRTRGLVAHVPGWILDRVIAPMATRHYVGDVLQDRAIWENKIHLARPRLAEGDGPIGRYRRWCRQFYPTPAQARAAS